MDSMFFNKIAGAVLLTVLIGFVITEVSHIVVHPTEPETVAYPVPEMAAAGETPAEPEEKEVIDVAALLSGGDIAKGESAFKKCAACHTIEEGGATKVGPNLFGVLNRDIASVDGFNYSGGLSDLEGDWTYEQLAYFLRKPKDLVSDTKMVFPGFKKDSDLAGIILYLRSFGDADTPLPAAQ